MNCSRFVRNYVLIASSMNNFENFEGWDFMVWLPSIPCLPCSLAPESMAWTWKQSFTLVFIYPFPFLMDQRAKGFMRSSTWKVYQTPIHQVLRQFCACICWHKNIQSSWAWVKLSILQFITLLCEWTLNVDLKHKISFSHVSLPLCVPFSKHQTIPQNSI